MMKNSAKKKSFENVFCAFVYKVKTKVHRELIINSKKYSFYYWLYKSYRHSFFYKHINDNEHNNVKQYISSRPNPGAGIGHQLANWFAGLRFARDYGLDYSVYPFSSLDNPLKPNEWDSFLGLNEEETLTDTLINKGYRLVLLPKIDYSSEVERNIIYRIIKSYQGERVVFLLEMDQFVGYEIDMIDLFRNKYEASTSRKYDKVIYSPQNYNVAIHIRRGDIVQNGAKKNDNLTMRWLDIDYYITQLKKYLYKYSQGKNVAIYLFSQSEETELRGFDSYGSVYYCNKMSAIESFLHMVQADMLIMSRSGMSYQAAKLNKKGIIIFPKGFWREPLTDEHWIVEKEDDIKYDQ